MTDGSGQRSTAVLREMQHEDHPAPDRVRVDGRALWFGVLAGPAAWAIHTVVLTSLNSFGCLTGRSGQPPAGTQIGTATWIGLMIVSAAMLVIAVAALFTSWRSWRMAQTDAAGEGEELLEVGEGRARFMAMGGILLGALFSVLLLTNTIPLFLAPQCIP